ncbi:uncharacterized protein EDB93DRAFT_1181658 [Suillus bovinus]|uniref:uncharacterized protein n=1 Tax=Suillus bovinus TaxID=48563 RepID=UPI001B884324|nr:uncharacterized protein EDB93DRAFT_1181658 [Suillus bovinus]KAG2129841.1 hypothetical protein EDB93DRAFT_1181658 [Suillus bovinus]
MVQQAGQSAGSQNLRVIPLPFTQTQRDELDQTIHNALANSSIVESIRDSDENLSYSNYSMVLAMAFYSTCAALRKLGLDNVLDMKNFVEIMLQLESHQQLQLQKMIKEACMTGIFSRICDAGKCLSQLYRCTSADGYWRPRDIAFTECRLPHVDRLGVGWRSAEAFIHMFI